ncbi:hypothetical protein ELI24_34525 [Rhizobium ruizarguesonis]|uniref:Uncharacterized protein n=1 Tax=Rhizobium ruizarguesonis TaxID=2081791 RepID=A0ABY1WZE3_9HYPH|nr:hypothetical protein ELI48_32580 [Rhizobium ruizarguesonis]TAU58595.1 hypothetical protein ELI45_33795 [Rhizobium ruizarguesonis]TAV03033.1 hypothetical protein ELI34_31855 [Rhizobium ruizarguesonis]TAV19352.1 hypothetical protein ELI35_36585 [Rhizobium ruizarguesonis]TAV21946.1 hypothetical protein ELI36_30860 [Rhizobium ruizarguesonis]
MHLLPQSFDFQTAHSSSQGTSVGTAALLLPVAVRFSESLPHLLPRQAFSYAEPSVLRIECDCSNVAIGIGWRPLENPRGRRNS